MFVGLDDGGERDEWEDGGTRKREREGERCCRSKNTEGRVRGQRIAPLARYPNGKTSVSLIWVWALELQAKLEPWVVLMHSFIQALVLCFLFCEAAAAWCETSKTKLGSRRPRRLDTSPLDVWFLHGSNENLYDGAPLKNSTKKRWRGKKKQKRAADQWGRGRDLHRGFLSNHLFIFTNKDCQSFCGLSLWTLHFNERDVLNSNITNPQSIKKSQTTIVLLSAAKTINTLGFWSICCYLGCQLVI